MTDTIPDHVGREAVRLLNESNPSFSYAWPSDYDHASIRTVAKLLMNPPAPMTDPDEEAAKRVLMAGTLSGDHNYAQAIYEPNPQRLKSATEQMRKEREAWEAGR